MKIATKNIPGAAMSRAAGADQGAASAAAAVEQCENLRPVAGAAGVLAPVGQPRKVCDGSAGRCHAATDGSGREWLLMERGQELWACPADGSAAAERLALLPGPVKALVADGAGWVTVMAEGSTSPLYCDGTRGGWTWLGAVPELPLPALRAKATSRHDHTLPARKLQGLYTTHSDQLGGTDLATLSADFSDAYAALYSQATAAGEFLQPVLARVRAVGRRGMTVAVSQPVMLLAPDLNGNPLNLLWATRTIVNDEGATQSRVTATRLVAAAYRLELCWPEMDGEAWDRWVERVDIEVSPQLHATCRGAVSQQRMTTVSGSLAVQLSLPGTAITGPGDGYRRMVVHAAGAFDRIATTAWCAMQPVGGWSEWAMSSLDCFSTFGLTLWEETKKLLGLCNTVADPGEGAALAPDAPHRFTAGCGERLSDVTVWGNLEVAPWHGAWAAQWSSACADEGDWQGQVHVDFSMEGAGGRVCSLTHTCRPAWGKPLAAGPLLMWPDARATRLTLSVGTRRWSVTLRPTPDGRAAYWLNPTLHAVPLEQWTDAGTAVAIAENPWTEERRGTLALCRATDPTRTLATLAVSEGTVTALASRERTGAGLEYGRLHLHALSTDGVSGITVDSGRTSLTARRLADVGLQDPRLACRGDDGLWLVQGTALWQVGSSGVRAVERCLPAGICAAGHCAATGELWLLDGAGHALVRTAAGRWFARTDLGAIASLSTSGGRLWVGHGEQVSLADEEGERESTLVRWRAALPLGGQPPAGAVWQLSAGRLNGTLRLWRRPECGSEAARTITRLTVHGPLSEPVAVRLPPLAWASGVCAGVVGEVDATFRLRGVELTLARRREAC